MPLKNVNRPAPGSSIRVEPIRDLKAISRIKRRLQESPRDLCLFTLGINMAYRCNELLSIQVEQVEAVRVGDTLNLKQSKTQKYRAVALNNSAVTAIHQWLDYRPLCASPYLFNSKKGDVLTVPTVSRMVKQWCQDVGLKGNYGSHSLRKTWGYHQRQNGAPLPLLTMAFGHGSQAQTLQYLGIQEQEISDLYDLEL